MFFLSHTVLKSQCELHASTRYDVHADKSLFRNFRYKYVTNNLTVKPILHVLV